MLKRIMLVMLFCTNISHAASLDKIVAVVNEGVITESELTKQVEITKGQMLASRMPLPDENTLRKQVLQQLIDMDIQLQIAKQNNMNVDDKELTGALNKIATNNKITLDTLKSAVIQQGMDWDSYRENIRRELLLSHLQQNAVGKNIPVITEQQVQNFIKANGTNLDPTATIFHLQNIVIPLPETPDSEQVTRAKAKAASILARIEKGEDFNQLAIAESSGEFALVGGDLGERNLAQLPEIFAREVVRMKPGEVAGPLRTGNGFQLIKLVAVSGDHVQHRVHKTHARHILLKNDSSRTDADAERQAQNIYQQLKSGKDFALMAKQYSLDAATAIKGGDLGWVTAGELVPEFEKVMDKLPLNKVSKPVKTHFGWHLIQVLERKTVDDTEAFNKQKVRNLLQQRKFTEAVQNWQQHIRGSAYVNILDKDLA